MPLESLTALEDDFERVSFICTAVTDHIEGAGVDFFSDEARNVVTETEYAIARMTQFFCLASNSGRLYPYLDYGLELLPFLERMNLPGTVSALRALSDFAQKHICSVGSHRFQSKIEPVHESLEAPAEGDFEWAERIMQYVRANPDEISVLS